MHLTLIINSIVCLLGVVVGLFFAGGSIISIANMQVSWSGVLVVAALLVPIFFAVSGIGAWIAHHRAATQLAIGLIALPWLWTVLFVIAMLASFDR
ncbi:MAG: hypothetical protein JWN98_1288 [Abditibacteriota bacterium]|nr:hypothetical protein [Abditibacteriota bacterium]